jgi:hypothetical protein
LMTPLTPAQSSPGPIFSIQTPTTGMGNGTLCLPPACEYGAGSNKC